VVFVPSLPVVVSGGGGGGVAVVVPLPFPVGGNAGHVAQRLRDDVIWHVFQMHLMFHCVQGLKKAKKLHNLFRICNVLHYTIKRFMKHK
jgi:hypothetical protein